jgi:hypothetical protein
MYIYMRVYACIYMRVYASTHISVHTAQSDTCTHLSNLPGFVISSQNSDTLGVTKFQQNYQSNTFYRVIPSVNIVSLQDHIC